MRVIHFFIFCSVFYFSSCNGQGSDGLPADEQAEEEEVLTSDRWFRFQQQLNIGDSMQAVVLGWGGESSGNYVVMLADSSQDNYVATTQYRNGKVQAAWAEDLDEDGWPEIIVNTQSTGSGEYGEVYVHELEDTYSFTTYFLPQLSETLGADYRGHDHFYVQDGRLVREFRLYDDQDNRTTAWRRIFYELEGNRLVVMTSEELEDL